MICCWLHTVIMVNVSTLSPCSLLPSSLCLPNFSSITFLRSLFFLLYSSLSLLLPPLPLSPSPPSPSLSSSPFSLSLLLSVSLSLLLPPLPLSPPPPLPLNSQLCVPESSTALRARVSQETSQQEDVPVWSGSSRQVQRASEGIPPVLCQHCLNPSF